MAKTLAQIEKELDSLRREAERIRKSEVAGVVARIKEAIRYYGLSPQDLGFHGDRADARRKTVKTPPTRPTAKYRDPSSGRTWTGRGRRPQWFLDALAAGETADDLMRRT